MDNAVVSAVKDAFVLTLAFAVFAFWFGGDVLIRKWLEHRHEQRMAALRVREIEAQAKLEEARRTGR